MISLFLKAKHWQLFLLTFAIPVSFQVFMMLKLFADFEKAYIPDPQLILSYMKFMPLVLLLFIGIHFGWIYSLAIGLQDKLPAGMQLKVKKFKRLFFISLAYMTFVLLLFPVSPSEILSRPSALLLILALLLFSMFGIFYSIYFVAKTIKSVELQREVGFSEFVGEFFMIFFHPFGIWLIQPKVNLLSEKGGI